MAPGIFRAQVRAGIEGDGEAKLSSRHQAVTTTVCLAGGRTAPGGRGSTSGMVTTAKEWMEMRRVT